MKRYWMPFLMGLVWIGASGAAYALDTVVLPGDTSSRDKRWEFHIAVLDRALEATEETDGSYIIKRDHLHMTFDRALAELTCGSRINASIASTQDKWETSTIPIRIPILKGLGGYRLLLVNCSELDRFKAVNTLEDLRKLKAGSGPQWLTTEILRKAKCNLVTSSSYLGLFAMLKVHRFDYLPRGVNEVYSELEALEDSQGLCIEPSLILYSPMPTYFFVSNKYPKLADRIRRGMQILVDNGTLDRMFQATFGEAIRRADLNHRRYIAIPNPLLPAKTPLNNPALWFTP